MRKSNSGSGAFLGVASDGNEYWVKAPNNPQGPRTLVAETVCYGLGRAIGAPVCENALIDIPTGMDWEYARGYRLRGGVGHGSLNVTDAIESDEWATYSARDDNRSRQASLFALWDLCMGADPQWLHKVVEDYTIWSFDHGFWLAGEVDWSIESLRAIGVKGWHYDIDAAVTSARALRGAAERVEALSAASIRAVTDLVPLEWSVTKQELSELADILLRRAAGVADRLRDAADQSRYA